MSEEQPSKNSGGSDGNGAPKKKKVDKLLGTVLSDRYEILSVLGRGGMGVVYKGRRTLIDRYVAIKVLKQGLLENETSKKRFEQEAKACAKLNHPHLISVFDYGYTDKEEPYLVMDFLEGQSLEDLFQDLKVLPIDRFLRIFQQTCRALNYIHKLGVVHRDLKPSNIMLVPTDDDPDYVKLVDFGIAKIVKADEITIQRLTQTGQSFGSPLYMSPEQCMGKDVDARSDVYSLGCVAFELLTGQAPICGENALQTLFMHVNEQPLSFEQANKSVSLPESLQTVLLKSLEKNPAKRFSTAAEFGEAITDAIMNDTRTRQQVSKEGWTVYKKPVQHAEANPSPPVNEQTIPPPLPKQNDEQSKRNLAESKISLPPPLPVQQEEDEKKKRGLAESKISLPPPLPVQPEADEKKKRGLAESKISLPPPLPVQQDQKGTTPPPIPRDLESSIPPPLPHEQKSTVPPPLPRQDEFNLRAPEKPKGLTADKRGTEKKDQTPPTTLPEATTTKNGGSGGDTQRTLKKEAFSKESINKESEPQPVKANFKVFAGIGALAVFVYVFFFFSPLHLYDQAIGVVDPYAKSIATAQELFDAGRFHDAAQQYEDILPKAKEKFGEKSRGYEAVLLKLCQSMSNAHTNPEQLSKYLDQCLEILKDEKDEAAVSDRAELCLMRGFLFDDQGQYWSAINEFRTALALRKERFGDGTPKVAHALSLLGEEYKKANNLTDADSELSSALRMYKDQQVPDYVALIETSLALGDVKNQSNQFDEAEKLIQNARDYRSKLPDQESIQSQELRTKIATLDEKVSQNKLKHSLPPAAVAPSPAVPPAPVVETGSKAAALLRSLPIKVERTKQATTRRNDVTVNELVRKAEANRAATASKITTTSTSTSSKKVYSPYDTWNLKSPSPPGSVMPSNSTTANPYLPDNGTVWRKFNNIQTTPTPPPTNINWDPSVQGSRGVYDPSANVSNGVLKRSKNSDGSTRWDPYYNTAPNRPNP